MFSVYVAIYSSIKWTKMNQYKVDEKEWISNGEQINALGGATCHETFSSILLNTNYLLIKQKLLDHIISFDFLHIWFQRKQLSKDILYKNFVHVSTCIFKWPHWNFKRKDFSNYLIRIRSSYALVDSRIHAHLCLLSAH